MGGQLVKKIVLLNPEANWGGGERCLWDLVIGSQKQNPPFRFHVILGSAGPLAEALKNAGISCEVIALPEGLTKMGDGNLPRAESARLLPGFFRYLSRLKEAIRLATPDLIHSNGIKSHLISRLVTPHDVPIIWHMHDFISNRAFSKRALRFLSSKTTALVCNSHATQWDVSSILHNIPSQVVWNGIDTDSFSPRQSSESSKKIRVGLVATYAVWKGHTFFLDAIQQLANREALSNVEVQIIGGPIYRSRDSQHQADELMNQIRNRGLVNVVSLLPFREEIASAYQNLDIVVHASTKPEPFGRTVIEAMSTGKAVIASAEGGPVEIIRHHVDGLLYQPRSVTSLSETIDSLLKSEELRKKLGTNARETVLKKFSREIYCNNMASFYKEIFSTRIEPTQKLQRRLTIAMGIREDQWNSMKNYAQGLFDSIADKSDAKDKFGIPVFLSPSFKKAPTWVDRRVRYPLTVKESRIFHLTDHSYADTILHAKAKSEKTIIVVHDLAFWRSRNLKNFYFRNKILRGIRSADVRVTDSLAIAHELKAAFGITTDAVIPPGIPDQFVHTDDKRDPHLFVHVGDTGYRKGIERLLCFMHFLPPEFKLIQVGGKFSPSQRSMMSRWNLEKRVVEAGRLPLHQLVALYQKASALLFPSRYEGFGIPVIEARACGTPVIISPDVPALEHLRYDPGTLILNFEEFETQERSEGKRRCMRFFQDFERRPSRLAHRENFQWETISQRYLQIYESLL